MSFSLSNAASDYRIKVTITPRERRSEQQRLPGELNVPDGVELSSQTLKGERDPVAPHAGPPVPNSDPQAGPASFTAEDVARVAASTEGEGRWTSLSTKSGLRGQVLEGTDGLQFKVLLPSGVLPQPLLIAGDGHQVTAFGLGEQPQSLPAAEHNGRIEVPLDGALAVFDQNTYTFGMETPEVLERDDTNTKREPSSRALFDDDYAEVTRGTKTWRQNLAEYVHPDGSHEIIADRKRTYKYEENGHQESTSYYHIQDGRAEHVVQGEDYSWYSEPYSSHTSHGTRKHPLDVERAADGSYLLTPAGGLRGAAAAVTNWGRNFGKMIFVEDTLQARPVDLEVVKPFSSNPK